MNFRKGYIMKRYICSIIRLLIISMIFQMTTAIAAEETKEYIYTVSGYAMSRLEGQAVSVNVFYPGKSEADFAAFPKKDVLLYHAQGLTGENGFFEFEFSTLVRGEYIATVRVTGEENLREIKAVEKSSAYVGTPIFSMDFEEIPTDIYIDGNVTNDYTDAEHGKSLVLAPGASSVLVRKTLDEPIESGAYLIEYDTSFSRTDNYSYFRLSNIQNNLTTRNNVFEGTVFSSTGVLGYYNQCRGFNIIPYKEYAKDTWYNIKMWLDFDRAEVYYYINGTLMGKTGMPTDMMKRIYTLGFISERNTGGVQYIDNFSLKKFNGSLLRSLDKSVVPEVLLNSMVISASDKVTGNIYFNNKGTFYWNLENMSDKAETLSITYELKNADGEILFSKSEHTDIYAETKKEMSIPVEFDKFGIYKMKITVANENIFVQKEPELSYVHSTDSLSGISVCTHFGQGKGEASKIMPLISKMGVGFIRDECYWQDYEKEKGVYKLPETYKAMLDEANDCGIEVLQLLTYSNPLYGNVRPWENDVVLAGFEEYCYHLASELKGRVKYFEVWNEYDLNNSAGADGYVKLLKAGYRGVKRGNPNAFVVATTPLNVGTSWMDSVFTALNGEKYMDIIAIHPYNEFIPESSNPTWGYVGKFDIAHSKMEEYGYGDLPIWATELGWPLNNFPNQAEYTVRLSLLNEAHKERMMDKMFFYDFQNDGVRPDESENNYGMIKAWKGADVPYAAKESYLAMSNYNAILGGAELVSFEERNNGDYVYKFISKSGKTVYALWNINGDNNVISIDTDLNEATLYDFYGNAEKQRVNQGRVSVSVSGAPVYLEFDDVAEISCEGKTVKSLNDVPDGKNVLAKVKNFPEGASLYAAAYKDGRIAGVETALKSEELTVSILKSRGCDKIKFFLWKDLKPLIEDIELVGETL